MKRLTISFALLLASAAGTLSVRAAQVRENVLPTVPAGFEIETIAHLEHPRELAAAANGDLLVGTGGDAIDLIPHASGAAGVPHVFTSVPDNFAAGIALADGFLYIGTTSGVWRVPFKAGDERTQQPPAKIASVRPGGGGGHVTTSVAVAEHLYASVGSSCNACTESDPTRATIQEMSPEGRGMHARATHIRNAIALAIDPETQALWAGDAGQDGLEHGHPYEVFDDVSARPGTPDYSWPMCFENHRSVEGTHDCGAQAVSRVVFPAYSTPIGASFYKPPANAAHIFPAPYRAGVFVALHGSWHTPRVPPRVVFVPMRRDVPVTPVDWNDPSKQWRPFVDGFQAAGGERSGRPTGIAVGPDGSLFVADDEANAVYRIRPKR